MEAAAVKEGEEEDVDDDVVMSLFIVSDSVLVSVVNNVVGIVLDFAT